MVAIKRALTPILYTKPILHRAYVNENNNHYSMQLIFQGNLDAIKQKLETILPKVAAVGPATERNPSPSKPNFFCDINENEKIVTAHLSLRNKEGAPEALEKIYEAMPFIFRRLMVARKIETVKGLSGDVYVPAVDIHVDANVKDAADKSGELSLKVVKPLLEASSAFRVDASHDDHHIMVYPRAMPNNNNVDEAARRSEHMAHQVINQCNIVSQRQHRVMVAGLSCIGNESQVHTAHLYCADVCAMNQALQAIRDNLSPSLGELIFKRDYAHGKATVTFRLARDQSLDPKLFAKALVQGAGCVLPVTITPITMYNSEEYVYNPVIAFGIRQGVHGQLMGDSQVLTQAASALVKDYLGMSGGVIGGVINPHSLAFDQAYGSEQDAMQQAESYSVKAASYLFKPVDHSRQR